MTVPKITGSQRDFSAGELDVTLKRADEIPTMKIGARQMRNYRVLSGGQASNRPGRLALFQESGRVEMVLMKPGQLFYLCLGAGYIRIFNASGARVFNSLVKGDGVTAIPWSDTTARNVTFAVAAGSTYKIYIAYADGFPLNVPQVLTWDGVSQTSTWTLATFAEDVTPGGQKQTFFSRISKQNVTMFPNAISGTGITIVFSESVLEAGMVGCRFAYIGRQLTMTGYTNGTTGTFDINEPLPQSQDVQFLTDPRLVFALGDEVIGSVSGSKGIITGIDATSMAIQLLKSSLQPSSKDINSITTAFITTDVVAGPAGSLKINSISALTPAQAISLWDDEVMNNFRGWPSTVFYDQSRLGFCNFPVLPSAIGWSQIGLPTSLLVNAFQTVIASNAIFDFVPNRSQVYFVVPGMESSEFVFCDNAIYYIPITAQSPLTPGSVAYNLISSQGAYPNVKPHSAGQAIIYMKAGGAQVGAVQTPGAYYRPNVVDDISQYHSHLFTGTSPVAIAAPPNLGQFEESYIYILMANGDVIVGKYVIHGGLLETGPDGRPKIGWAPWSGAGTTSWITDEDTDVVFVTLYPGATGAIVERLDNTQYLDGAIPVNNVPPALAAPPGKGPLWWQPSSTVCLMDRSTRSLGAYKTDANGFIIPQFLGGEDLSRIDLYAGQTWAGTLEPFVPDAQPGESHDQRMRKRRVSRMAVYVTSSTGFLFARLYAGERTNHSDEYSFDPLGFASPDFATGAANAPPVFGQPMNTRRITTYNQDDDPTQAPPLRETVERWRPLGRDFDPRMAIVKDTPGPLIIHEIGFEVTI